MISIYQLKPKFQQLLAPLLKWLQHTGIAPNQVTTLTIVICVGYGLLLFFYSNTLWVWACFPLIMLLRMALNAIDGMLANATNQKTSLGAILNEMGDLVSDVALYLPFCTATGVAPLWVIAVVIAALFVEFSGLMSLVTRAGGRRFDGPMGKSDRAFSFGLLAVLIAAHTPPIWLNGLLILVLVLSCFTMMNRLRHALSLH